MSPLFEKLLRKWTFWFSFPVKSDKQKEVVSLDNFQERVFFVFGCARSGTTSLCRILDIASNAKCLMEPNPNLAVESREHIDGILSNPKDVLRETLFPRITEALSKHEFYGEKNNTLTAFIQELYELFGSKFVFVTRDGRETVQSMYSWNKELFGNYYRECKEHIELSKTAKDLLAQLPVKEDSSNYSRPRPRQGDPYYEKWADLSLHEMLCWYWAFINDYALDRLKSIPQDKWIRVDYSSPDINKQIEDAVKFLGLEGIDLNRIDKMLNRRINSLSERSGRSNCWPTWQNWSELKMNQFGEICGKTMNRLGYPCENHANEKKNL